MDAVVEETQPVSTEEAQTPPVNPRDEMMDAIAKRRVEQMKQEGDYTEIPPEAPAETPPPEPEPIAESKPAEEIVRLKVDGQVVEMPASEFMKKQAEFQTHMAAEKRLAEAKLLKKELQERLNQAQATPGTTQLAPKDLEQAIEKIQYGTKEEAMVAFQEAVNRMMPSEDKLIERLRAENQRLEYGRKIDEQFAKEFPEIVADPYLNRIVTAETKRLLESGDERELYEIASEQAKTVREWAKKMSDGFAEKKERKKSLDHPVPASMRAEKPAEKRPPTRQEVIQQMIDERNRFK